ncbi:MAG: hypothetical protein HQ530_00945, partial [Parcubacteria group bacterium]|nr:hypothetical protein [Parcubacteria group bacterium]
MTAIKGGGSLATLKTGRVCKKRVQVKEETMSSQFSVGMMNQLGDSLEAAGYTSEDVTMLRSDVERLRMVKKVLDGEARITLVGEEEPVESKPPKDAPPPIQLIADLDADPFLP